MDRDRSFRLARVDSNHRPPGPEPGALPIAPRANAEQAGQGSNLQSLDPKSRVLPLNDRPSGARRGTRTPNPLIRSQVRSSIAPVERVPKRAPANKTRVGDARIELATSRSQSARAPNCANPRKCTLRDSNPRPSRCERDALPLRQACLRLSTAGRLRAARRLSSTLSA